MAASRLLEPAEDPRCRYFASSASPARTPPGEGETATVRRIAEQLERLDPAEARYLASFAYVLARIAHADLSIDDQETDEMHRIVRELASLSEAEASWSWRSPSPRRACSGGPRTTW